MRESTRRTRVFVLASAAMRQSHPGDTATMKRRGTSLAIKFLVAFVISGDFIWVATPPNRFPQDDNSKRHDCFGARPTAGRGSGGSLIAPLQS